MACKEEKINILKYLQNNLNLSSMRNSLKKQSFLTIRTTRSELSISGHFMFKNVEKLLLESLKNKFKETLKYLNLILKILRIVSILIDDQNKIFEDKELNQKRGYKNT